VGAVLDQDELACILAGVVAKAGPLIARRSTLQIEKFSLLEYN
jgi:hypothetical protein